LQAKLACLGLLFTILISSCSDPASVGLELAPGNNQVGVFFAEFDLPAEVVLLDSFNTTNQGLLVVGEEVDPYFGKTTGIGYSRMYFDSRAERPKSEAILDSIFFRLDVVSVNGRNLDQPKYFSIHRLAEPILDTSYYNFNELRFEEQPLAFSNVNFGETKDTTLTFPVDQDFAEDLFGKLKRGTEFNDIFSFRRYFPGIAVKSGEGQNTTIGVNLGFETKFDIYYHYQGDTLSKVYEINTSSSRSFNGVKSDRNGTPTSIITEPGKAYNTGDLVGLKANLGIAMKVNTAPFDNFLDTLNGAIFQQVEFVIGEINAVPSGQNPPSFFVSYFTDGTNERLSRASDKQPLTVQRDGQPQIELISEGKEEPAVRAPAIGRYNSNDKVYSMLITSYTNALYRNQLQRKDWLLYGNSPETNGDDFKRSFRQFIVNKNRIKVKAIYSKIK
jgi:hypothetical protein